MSVSGSIGLAHPDAFGHFGELLHEPVVQAFLHKNSGTGQAKLALVEKRGRRDTSKARSNSTSANTMLAPLPPSSKERRFSVGAELAIMI